ncbi:MAG: LOG family protein [Ignavibacteriaceae bacterium]
MFGSSKPTIKDDQYETAYKISKKLAVSGFDICSGGFNGIMEAVSKGAVEGGGQAIGVTVNLWGRNANRFVTKEIKCNTLFERINKLIEMGDGYLILQGGTGTLLELAAVWEFINKGLLKSKPVVCHSSLWKSIVKEMKKQMELEGRSTDLVKALDTPEEIVEYLLKNI